MPLPREDVLGRGTLAECWQLKEAWQRYEITSELRRAVLGLLYLSAPGVTMEVAKHSAIRSTFQLCRDRNLKEAVCVAMSGRMLEVCIVSDNGATDAPFLLQPLKCNLCMEKFTLLQALCDHHKKAHPQAAAAQAPAAHQPKAAQPNAVHICIFDGCGWTGSTSQQLEAHVNSAHINQ